LPRAPGETDLEIGCLWPLALVLAVAIGIGVLIGTRLQNGPAATQQAVVRVIDDSASPGPKIIGTAVVPLR
jgi:hypothetical protein